MLTADRGTTATSRRSRAWLVAALLLFCLQVVPFLSHRWVTDESWYAGPGITLRQGHGLNDPGFGPNESEHVMDVRPPGTAIVMAGFFRVFGISEAAARAGSIVAGLLIILVLYALTRDVLGEEAAVLCALLGATDNFLVTVSRTVRPEALTILCILLGLLAVKAYWRRGNMAAAFGCGLLMALGTMFHVTLLGFVVAYGILLLVLDWQAKRFPLRGVAAYSVSYLAGLAPYAVWVLTAPNNAGRINFRAEFIGKAKSAPLLVKLLNERARYNDYFGFGMLHGHGLDHLPVRLPIAVLFFAASYVLWRFRRRWFSLELLLLVPSMLWLVYTANKSSRYLSLLAPVTAMVLAAAYALVQGRPVWRRWALRLAAFTLLAQFGANLLLLNSARKADYHKVTAELQSVIPPGAKAYGTITFWMGLRDHPYVASEHTDPIDAYQLYGAKYFITGDRMMANGSPTDMQYFVELRQHYAQVVAKGHMVGEFNDPYYGDLKIFYVP